MCNLTNCLALSLLPSYHSFDGEILAVLSSVLVDKLKRIVFFKDIGLIIESVP